jgi:hypothetical protein
METYEYQPPAEQQESEQLSLTDKISGIITSPAATFGTMSAQPVKNTHWIIMLLLLVLTYLVTTTLVQMNSELKYQIKQKIEEKKNSTGAMLDQQIKQGKMTTTQKEDVLKRFDDQMDMIGTPGALVTQGIWLALGISFQFFIVALYFFACTYFFFGAEYKYNAVLSVTSLSAIVTMIEVILTTAFSLFTEKLTADLSVASIVSSHGHNLPAFIFGKLNPFSIWYFCLVSIGLAGMAKAANKMKYILFVFCSWIGIALLWYFITGAVPFLQQ